MGMDDYVHSTDELIARITREPKDNRPQWIKNKYGTPPKKTYTEEIIHGCPDEGQPRGLKGR